MALADGFNQMIDERQPWILAKDDSQRDQLQAICTWALLGFKAIATLLQPVLPRTTQRIAQEVFGLDNGLPWENILELPKRVLVFKHLLQRVDRKQIDTLIEANKDSLQPSADSSASQTQKANTAPTQPSETSMTSSEQTQSSADEAPAAIIHGEAIGTTISFDDFAKIDLRIALIVDAQLVKGSNKLLQLTVDVGEATTRNIFSGIRNSYQDPSVLIGRHTVIVANLAPRKMRFGVSEGMVLSAANAQDDLFLLSVEDGALPGMPVR